MSTLTLVVAISIGGVIALLLVAFIAAHIIGRRDDGTQHTSAPRGGSGDIDVDRLVAEGNLIAAIVRVRLITSWGLREAKDYVDAMPNVLPLPSAPPATRPDASLAEDSELRALVARGAIIEAIKRVREISGCGLREAKEIVDRIPRGQA